MGDFVIMPIRMRHAHLKSIVVICFWISALLPSTGFGQYGFLPPSNQLNKSRLTGVVITESIVGVVSMVALHRLWYRKHARSRFHFFNDNGEWMGMDKIGHATTAYNICTLQNDIFRWAGLRPGQSALYAGITAIGFQGLIEIFDGFSSGWGFSTGDMLANIAGVSLFSAQQAIWGTQKVSLQFSFHMSPYARYNPDLLGHRWAQRILKDYNGQTYWLSFNLPSIFPKAGLPTWLNTSFGYGASGMIGARENPTTVHGKQIPAFTRERRFLWAISPTSAQLEPTNPWISLLKFTNTIVKFPAPTLEYGTRSGFRLHPFYF
jgi:hypothetical protein